MTITQTFEISEENCMLTKEVPREIPAGNMNIIVSFSPASEQIPINNGSQKRKDISAFFGILSPYNPKVTSY